MDPWQTRPGPVFEETLEGFPDHISQERHARELVNCDTWKGRGAAKKCCVCSPALALKFDPKIPFGDEDHFYETPAELTIGDSLLPTSFPMKGLFAKVNLPAKTFLGVYAGKVYVTFPFSADQSYAFTVTGLFYQRLLCPLCC